MNDEVLKYKESKINPKSKKNREIQPEILKNTEMTEPPNRPSVKTSFNDKFKSKQKQI